MYLITFSIAELALPAWKFFAMGVLDAGSGYMITYAAGRITGSMASLLQQATIPMVMLASLLLLGTRYRIIQWLGAAVILGGVFLVVYPSLSDPSVRIRAEFI